LIGLDVTVSPERRGNSSGDSDATAPHSPVRYAARAGDVRSTASTKTSTGAPFDEDVDGRAVEATRELRAHAGMVDLARRDRFQTLEHAPAMRLAVGVAHVMLKCR
jgi:hypothetical protein